MVTIADIQEAHTRISPNIFHTPLIYSSSLSTDTGYEVYLKLETLQKAGSFKIRGAMNKILNHQSGILKKGVVAASAGNHAQGVAIAAQITGVPAIIIMPEWSSLSKQEATRGYGAEVVITGQTIEACVSRAEELSQDGRLLIHPYDDEEVIAGQGTIALELLRDLPDVDVIIVPVGGGGLISGIAIGAKSILPGCRIIGVQSSLCPSAEEAALHGKPVCIPARWTLADGIRVTKTGDITYPYIRDLVDEIVHVTDDEIAQSMLWLLERKKIISEGAGAVPLAALLFGRCHIRQKSRVALVISGGNIDSHQLSRVFRRALTIKGRLLRLSIKIHDQPGSLARLLMEVGQEGGNILHIHHTPGDPGIPIQTILVEIDLETRGPEHLKAIRNRIEACGYDIVR